jgi:mannan endo-1,6-alpha-mannosidase
MSEVSCEVNQKCNYDQPSFKAYLSAWLAFTTQMVPWTRNLILPKLQASAIGASKQCSGPGLNGNTCGRRWWQATWDGEQGVGEEMSALSVFGSNLIPQVKAPVTAKTGGDSPSNPGAGTQMGNQPIPGDLTKITTKDRAGAIMITILICGFMTWGAYWLISP